LASQWLHRAIHCSSFLESFLLSRRKAPSLASHRSEKVHIENKLQHAFGEMSRIMVRKLD